MSDSKDKAKNFWRIHSVVLGPSLGVVWFLFVWSLLSVFIFVSSIYTACVSTCTPVCIGLYHIVQCTLYFLFPPDSLGDFSMVVCIDLSIFFLKQKDTSAKMKPIPVPHLLSFLLQKQSVFLVSCGNFQTYTEPA